MNKLVQKTPGAKILALKGKVVGVTYIFRSSATVRDERIFFSFEHVFRHKKKKKSKKITKISAKNCFSRHETNTFPNFKFNKLTLGNFKMNIIPRLLQ
jgi:hypothetical protein